MGVEEGHCQGGEEEEEDFVVEGAAWCARERRSVR